MFGFSVNGDFYGLIGILCFSVNKHFYRLDLDLERPDMGYQ